MNILVTGGAGYVGSALVPRLLRQGHRVRILDVMLFDNAFVPAGAELVRGDVREPEPRRRALAGMDAVVHLAAVGNDPEYRLAPALGTSINVDASVALVDDAIAAGVERFVFASSCSVYGRAARGEDVTEASPLSPLTDYARSKVAVEEKLRALAPESLGWTILRPATVFGLAPRQRLDLLVNGLVANAALRGEIRLRAPERVRPNVFVDDLAEVYGRVLEADLARVRGRSWNVAWNARSVLASAEIVAGLFGARVESEADPTSDARTYQVSSARIEAELGVPPVTDLAGPARALGDALRAGELPGAPDAARYHNLRAQAEALARLES